MRASVHKRTRQAYRARGKVGGIVILHGIIAGSNRKDTPLPYVNSYAVDSAICAGQLPKTGTEG